MKLRRWCKRLLLGALAGGSGMIIAACYGPDNSSGMSSWELASGQVTYQNNGVAALSVCARFNDNASACVTTDPDGRFQIDGDEAQWHEATAQGFLVTVEDVDQADNGGDFASKDVLVAADKVPAAIDDIALELKPATPAH